MSKKPNKKISNEVKTDSEVSKSTEVIEDKISSHTVELVDDVDQEALEKIYARAYDKGPFQSIQTLSREIRKRGFHPRLVSTAKGRDAALMELGYRLVRDENNEVVRVRGNAGSSMVLMYCSDKVKKLLASQREGENLSLEERVDPHTKQTSDSSFYGARAEEL